MTSVKYSHQTPHSDKRIGRGYMLTKYYLIIIEIILVNDMQIFAFPLYPYYLRK